MIEVEDLSKRTLEAPRLRELLLGPDVTAGAAAAMNQLEPGQGLRVTQLRVVRSEYTKSRSLRSTLYTLLLAAFFMIGLGAVFAGIQPGQAKGLDAGQTAVSVSLTGTFFAPLSIGVLGVLVISGEYSTGMGRAWLTVVPTRLPMLWAKLAVRAGAVFLTMLVSSFVAVFFVIRPLTRLLPAPWSDHFVQYLPSNAGGMLIDGTYGVAHPLAPRTGFAMMCTYAVVLIAFAAWRPRRADA
jgi:hypothetical protein